MAGRGGICASPCVSRNAGWAALLAAACFAAPSVRAQTVEDVQGLSISELSNLPVSSATKTTKSLSSAPAAIYVITHDDIVRSGATTLPRGRCGWRPTSTSLRPAPSS